MFILGRWERRICRSRGRREMMMLVSVGLLCVLGLDCIIGGPAVPAGHVYYLKLVHMFVIR